ncbi:MAG: hypothetical protein Q7T03_04595 [Deltaproteobacteria bacterium]|nr:hypothetical protein [Deltaproteobacteria bacterium]
MGLNLLMITGPAAFNNHAAAQMVETAELTPLLAVNGALIQNASATLETRRPISLAQSAEAFVEAWQSQNQSDSIFWKRRLVQDLRFLSKRDWAQLASVMHGEWRPNPVSKLHKPTPDDFARIPWLLRRAKQATRREDPSQALFFYDEVLKIAAFSNEIKYLRTALDTLALRLKLKWEELPRHPVNFAEGDLHLKLVNALLKEGLQGDALIALWEHACFVKRIAYHNYHEALDMVIKLACTHVLVARKDKNMNAQMVGLSWQIYANEALGHSLEAAEAAYALAQLHLELKHWEDFRKTSEKADKHFESHAHYYLEWGGKFAKGVRLYLEIIRRKMMLMRQASFLFSVTDAKDVAATARMLEETVAHSVYWIPDELTLGVQRLHWEAKAFAARWGSVEPESEAQVRLISSAITYLKDFDDPLSVGHKERPTNCCREKVP